MIAIKGYYILKDFTTFYKDEFMNVIIYAISRNKYSQTPAKLQFMRCTSTSLGTLVLFSNVDPDYLQVHIFGFWINNTLPH